MESASGTIYALQKRLTRLVRTWPSRAPASIAHHDTGEHEQHSNPERIWRDPIKREQTQPLVFCEMPRISDEIVDVINDRDEDRGKPDTVQRVRDAG